MADGTAMIDPSVIGVTVTIGRSFSSFARRCSNPLSLACNVSTCLASSAAFARASAGSACFLSVANTVAMSNSSTAPHEMDGILFICFLSVVLFPVFDFYLDFRPVATDFRHVHGVAHHRQ